MVYRFGIAPWARALWAVLGTAVLAMAAGGAAERVADVDRRSEERGARLAAPVEPNEECPAPGVRVARDPLMKTPRFVYSPDGFLSRPVAPAPGKKTAANLVPDPHAPVKSFLDQHAAWLGHGSPLLQSTRVERDYVTPHNGQRTVVWQQEAGGIEVFGACLAGHITRQGELVSLSDQLLAKVAVNLATSTVQRALAQSPAVPPARAMLVAAQDAGEAAADEALVQTVAPPVGADAQQQLAGPVVRGTSYVRLVWLPLDEEACRLCWEVVFTGQVGGRMYRTLVDALTSKVWLRQNCTYSVEPASYRVYVDRSPTPLMPGWAFPTNTQPAEVERQLVTLTALNTNASPAGWLFEGMTNALGEFVTNQWTTVGNNVDAHLDWDGNNTPDNSRPISTNRAFDFALSLASQPRTYANASVVNLFYWCNFAHDQLYDFGFTEAAGNFQATNFGRGGVEGDAVQADAQDGSGYNNANFDVSPRDGQTPRMQMYLFSAPYPYRDGCLDAEVVLHEYTHGLTSRMLGGGSGGYYLGSGQPAGLAEGWSDFVAMALLSKSDYELGANYPFSSYVSYKFKVVINGEGEKENYYYGLRHYPYSTNMGVNPLTFRFIDSSQASPPAGIPYNSALGWSVEEHFVGEVWCAMLWDMRASLIARHGFESGNRIALQLVVDGIRNCPYAPTFTDARNAILLADLVNYGGANRLALWSVFARRGLGVGASAPWYSSLAGAREDYSMPDDLEVTPLTATTITGYVGGVFSPLRLSFCLSNPEERPIDWSLTGDSLLVFSTNRGTVAPRGTNLIEVTLDKLVRELSPGTYTQTLAFVNETVNHTQLRTNVLVIVREKEFLVQSFSEGNFDLTNSTLTFLPDGTAGGYQVLYQSATNFPTDPAGGSQVVLQDDNYVPITLTNQGQTVAIFGERTNVFYLCGNGHLDLTAGNGAYFEPGYDSFYAQSRVAAFYYDLHAGQGGMVTSRELSNRVAVTWLDVPEYGVVNSNTFQIELFFDGAIRMTWLRMDAVYPQFPIIVGLSDGHGVPPSLVETDFTSFQPGGLTLSVPDGVEGQGTVTNAGWVILDRVMSHSVMVALSGSDPEKLLLPAGITIPAGQTQGWFNVTYPDNQVRDGIRTVRVTAEAAGFSKVVAMVKVADPVSGTLVVQPLASLAEGQGLVTNAGLVRLEPVPEAAVLVRLTSRQTNLVTIPYPGWVVAGAGQTSVVFGVEVRDNAILGGPSQAEIVAEVPGWGQASGLLSVRDNEPNWLALALPDVVGEAAGTMTNAGAVYVSAPVASNLVVQLASDNPARLQVVAPAVIPAGRTSAPVTLVVVDDAIVNDARPVAISAQAQGLVGVTNQVRILDDETVPAPLLVSPPAGATNVARLPVLRWYSGFGELLDNGDFESGDFSGWSNVVSASGQFVINGGGYATPQATGPYAPIQGRFEALSQQTSFGRRQLSQTILLSAQRGDLWLSWRDAIRNAGATYATNHQFRVEIRDEAGQPLSTVFATGPGYASLAGATYRRAALNAWRGRTVQVAFVEEDSLGCLNVSLDEVSVRLEPTWPVVFDVYFGTNMALSAANYVGSTTNNYWAITNSLASGQAYFWQVVARQPASTNASAVAAFTTTARPAVSVTITNPLDYLVVPVGTNLLLATDVAGSAELGMLSYYEGASLLGESFDAPYGVSWIVPSAGRHEVTAVFKDADGLSFTSRPVHILAVAGGTLPVQLFDLGSEWKYLDDGSNQGDAWREAGFDDRAWKSGRGLFGYGGGQETTVISYGSDPANKPITTYFRKTFTNLAELATLDMRLLYNDGAVVWFNGVRAPINILPYATISYTTRATREIVGQGDDSFQVVPGVILPGVNLIAVEIHKYTNNGPRMSFDMQLTATGLYPPAAVVTEPAAGAVIPAGQPVFFSASAAVPYGRIAEVVFFVDDAPAGGAVLAPFRMEWTNAVAGSHRLTAKVTTDTGMAISLGPVWFTVGNPSLAGTVVGDRGMQLAWPAPAEGFALESATNLTLGGWLPVTNGWSTSNGIYQVVVPVDAPARYFRLRK